MPVIIERNWRCKNIADEINDLFIHSIWFSGVRLDNFYLAMRYWQDIGNTVKFQVFVLITSTGICIYSYLNGNKKLYDRRFTNVATIKKFILLQ